MASRIQLTDSISQDGIAPHYIQPIGKGMYLFDSEFKGRTYVHVRKLLDAKIPTKDGISLTLQRCNELRMSLPYVDIAVTEMEQNRDTFYRCHLGGNWNVSVQSGFNCVDIRKFWLPDGATEICATRRGVSLTFPQYKELRNGLRNLDSFVTELRNIVPCYSDPNHDFANCVECTPYPIPICARV